MAKLQKIRGFIKYIYALCQYLKNFFDTNFKSDIIKKNDRFFIKFKYSLLLITIMKNNNLRYGTGQGQQGVEGKT